MATHELYLLHLGQLRGDSDPFNQVPGYLIRTATGRIVLVDTGNPAAMIGAEDATESIVQKRHLEEARSTQRYDPALWDLPGIRYREIEGDVEIEPGLRLLETSGHAIGHQSVFVETTDGPVILAVDAISTRDMITNRDFPDWYSDPTATNESIDRLLALADETGAYLIFGHEASQWDTLPKSPELFRRPAAGD
jgi:glyoxylase-like metal-dependent hydrolase (beta-lactamase superfamily II)